jgi:hypothetical protein
MIDGDNHFGTIEMALEGRWRPILKAHRLSFKQKGRAGRTEASFLIRSLKE